MKLLFIGDVIGRPGRVAVRKLLPELREEFAIDIVVANGENSAGGLGATRDTLEELRRAGVHAFTMGNHTWRKRDFVTALGGMNDVARPANYPPGVPGRGAILVETPDGHRMGLVNLLGRVFMEPFADPFSVGLELVHRLREQTPVVLVDMHAEATSEKVAMGWHLDGMCTGVVGTHTHVQTADERLLPGGTAYITDVGMTGPRDSVIGMEKERVLQKMLTGIPHEWRVASGPTLLCAVAIEADDQTGAARSIERIARMVD